MVRRWESEHGNKLSSEKKCCFKSEVIAAGIREFLDVCSFRFNPRTGSINLSEQSERKHSLVPHCQHWGALEQGTRLCLFQWPTDQAVIVLGSFQVCLNVIMTDNEGAAVRETLRSEYKKHVNSSLPVQLIELRQWEEITGNPQSVSLQGYRKMWFQSISPNPPTSVTSVIPGVSCLYKERR